MSPSSGSREMLRPIRCPLRLDVRSCYMFESKLLLICRFTLVCLQAFCEPLVRNVPAQYIHISLITSSNQSRLCNVIVEWFPHFINIPRFIENSRRHWADITPLEGLTKKCPEIGHVYGCHAPFIVYCLYDFRCNVMQIGNHSTPARQPLTKMYLWRQR